MNIFITRHGQTDFNVAKIWQGCSLNPSLNSVGKEQAIQLSNKLNSKLKGYDYHLYSSPLRRAYETGEIISETLKNRRQITLKRDLIEGDFGIAEGHTEAELKSMLPDELPLWKDLNNLDFKFKNGESKGEIGTRIHKQIDVIVNDSMHSFFIPNNIIIVTHSAAIRCLLLQHNIKREEIPFGEVFVFKETLENTRFRDMYDIKFVESF